MKIIPSILLLIISFQISLQASVKYVLECDERLIRASMNVALLEVGTGQRDTAKIKKYLVSVGLSYPNPYCAAGQYYCFMTAAKHLNLREQDIPIKRTGSTYYMFEDARKRSQIADFVPKVGDLIFWMKMGSIRGHTERVIFTGRAGWVITIGFNAFLNGNYGVYILKRNIYHPLKRLSVLGLIGFIPITREMI